MLADGLTLDETDADCETLLLMLGDEGLRRPIIELGGELETPSKPLAPIPIDGDAKPRLGNPLDGVEGSYTTVLNSAPFIYSGISVIPYALLNVSAAFARLTSPAFAANPLAPIYAP